MRYGLVGEKLKHSYSPKIHAMLADYEYAAYEVAPGDLGEFLTSGGFGGLNITIPYKRAVIAYCSEVDARAKRTGSVNTLLYEGGRIRGYNTDYDGFQYMAMRAGAKWQGAKVLILGSGGTSATVKAVAEDGGAREVLIISRNGPVRYEDLSLHADADILVNTTPVGMYPDNGACPVSVDGFPHLQCVLDVIYNPLYTQLIQQARVLGIPALGGLTMLVEQARVAAGLFSGSAIPKSKTEEVYHALSHELCNIVLIGMPGCGKSRTGCAVAEALGRELVDTDRVIEERALCSIPEFFKREGEARFRELEAEVIEEAGRRTGCVIATGGGSVLREENRMALKQNGYVIGIEREIESLSRQGRPLSTDLVHMAEERRPVYRAFEDANVNNDGALQDAVQAVISGFSAAGIG